MDKMRVTKFPEKFKNIAEELASTYGPEYHGCAQVVVATFMEILGIEDEQVLMAASCFAGGGKRCLTCGAISGGLIVLGLKYGRRRLEDGVEAEEAAIAAMCSNAITAQELYFLALKVVEDAGFGAYSPDRLGHPCRRLVQALGQPKGSMRWKQLQ